MAGGGDEDDIALDDVTCLKSLSSENVPLATSLVNCKPEILVHV